MNVQLPLVAFSLSWLALSGCVSQRLDESLTKGVGEREDEFSELFAQIDTVPTARISWENARQRMMSDNLALQRSRKMLEDAGRQTKHQWLSLVPKMSAFLNIGKSLASLTDFSSDDLNAYVVASFNIPNPFEFYASLYGAALQNQNAVWSNELDQRRAYTELYTVFLEAQSIQSEEAAMAERRKGLSSISSADIAKELKNLASGLNVLKRRRMNLRENINILLNTPGRNWELTGKLPVISCRDRYRRFKIGEDFGKLALNLYAIQVEGAILQTQRVKFRQWPVISFGLSNPPLYSSNGENTYTAEDFSLFSGASKSLDVADIGGRESIRDAELRLKFTRGQLRQRMAREAVRIYQICAVYDDLLLEEGRLVRDIERSHKRGSTEPEVVIKDIELRSQLEMELIRTRRQMQQLDLQFLIWDERFWKA